MTKSRHKKMALWKKVLLIIGAILLCLILIAGATLGTLWLRGRQALLTGETASLEPPNELEVTVEDDQTVVYNGKRYVYNKNMTAILCMGVDQTAQESAYTTGNGQADTLFLLSIDTETGKTTVLNISRDIMAEVGIYNESGVFTGIETKQICLAYAYGDGAEGSCENTALAVSRLLYGIPVNTYFCVNWSAIPLLTDAIGGVTVPAYDEDWNPTGGTVYLSGSNAESYLRGRRHDTVTANNNRMERQIAYLNAYAAKVIERTRANPSFPLGLFRTIGEQSINTVDASRITYLSSVFLANGAQLDFRSIEGEVKMGEEFAEMYVDQQALFELVLELFYQEEN